MTQLSLIKSSAGVLVPATPETTEFLQSKVKLGSILCADFRQVRNAAFHRKYFSLLNLGFDYWQPCGGAVSPVERKLVAEYCRFLASYGGSVDTLQEAADLFLERVGTRRAANITGTKSFDAFREWLTIESGYFDVFIMPNGAVHKRAKSISFAKMDETAFAGLYKSTLDVLWTFILSKSFPNQQVAENTAAQLMNYAGHQ